MEIQIFSYPLIVLALLCVLNGFDYWDDYRKFYSWQKCGAPLRYSQHLRKHAHMCWYWSLVWAIAAGVCWYYEPIYRFILA